MRLPADPDAWIRFTNETLTVNGTTEHQLGSGPLPCPTLTLPATVTDGVVVFGEGAAQVPEANNICGARIGTFAPGKVRAAVVGDDELRISVDEGANKHVLIFSGTKPEPPAVPTTVDLSFLAPPTGQTIREKLANPLAGRDFVATKITGRTIAKPGIRMTFGTDQVGLSAGCNGGGAGYSVDGSTVTFTPGAWTAMGCVDARGEQESWLLGFTGGSAQFQLSGSTLRLTANGQTMVLTEKPADATPQRSQEPGAGPTESPAASGDSPPELLMATIDEIVTPRGVQPLPALEKGEFWDQPPRLTIEHGALVFDVGCGQLWSDTTGTFPNLTAGAYDGTWLLQCPPNRSALADALRYILSGPLTVARDGAFLTITGRDNLVVTAHSAY